MNEDLKLGTILLVLCCFLWFYAIPYHIKGFLPALFPRSLTLAMLIPCLILLLSGYASRKSAQTRQEQKTPKAVKLRALSIVPVMIVYIFFIDIIGFYVTTALFIFIFLLFFGARKPVALVIFPIALPIVVYLVIGKTLHFPFPQGILF
ncbi:MAG: tripartite tricarboxylate transporter TctB family protein [Desulfohalobiaceae bacterium]|nr:tripartite tricarboxylate transporter TctB family protein [Desulfohalobiaceae bacterium]